ncbi:MAG: hypothetical protein WCT02_02215 [Candidatus Paceibacterota bacterium]
MNFWPTLIKLPLSIVVGLLSAFYFQGLCLNCTTDISRNQLYIGFVPAFLWVYLIISLCQKNELSDEEKPTPWWKYVLALPFIIIIPLALGILLQKLLNP